MIILLFALNASLPMNFPFFVIDEFAMLNLEADAARESTLNPPARSEPITVGATRRPSSADKRIKKVLPPLLWTVFIYKATNSYFRY